jgi:hypothetical protein
LVREWNALPPQEKVEVQAQGRRTVSALMAVKVAMSASRSAADPPPNWETAYERVARPGPSEEMAKKIVAYLQRTTEATAGDIAAAVGAPTKESASFKAALDMARDDGYVRRVGVALRGIKWDTTEWADHQLLEAPRVLDVEREIVSLVEDVGLASLDQISGELGLESDSPDLLAALERAIAGGVVAWYCNGIYGLAVDRLEGFTTKRDLWAETVPADDDPTVEGALAELEASIKGLASAMRTEESQNPEAPEEPEDDPYEGLRRVRELHEAGVLTDEEFGAKKADLLRRI